MLRLMKQKILDEEENSYFNGHAKSRNSAMCPPIIVSHVPVSVGSRSIPSSTNSSISSKGDDYVGNDTMDSAPMVSLHSNKRPIRQVSDDSPIESCTRTAEQTQECDPKTTSTTITDDKKKHVIQEEEEAPVNDEPLRKKRRIDLQKMSPSPPRPTMMLARDEDTKSLSSLHIFVRSQIEVFTATPTELSQPSPGRKQPIKLHQVGLRCIHCRDLPSRKRVKRAVCYPSSVSRVYHSVSDMKFDHFSNCKSMPAQARAEFERLKLSGAKQGSSEKKTKGNPSSSSTSQYYHDAALQMGMVNGPGGIFLSSPQPIVNRPVQMMHFQQTLTPRPGMTLSQPPMRSGHNTDELAKISMQKMFLSTIDKPKKESGSPFQKQEQRQPQQQPLPQQPPMKHAEEHQMRITLAAADDTSHLNPLHCFVRKHVEFFTASKADIAAPAPGRKARVILGQVGIRCVHCAALPPKERVKRTVCYPPSIGAIYHSVSNMKFDHFALCKGLPPKAREEFQVLKASCSRRGTAGNNNGKRGSSSSTAQYYQDSAVRKGLVDTKMGIFVRSSGMNNETKQESTMKTEKDLLPQASRAKIPSGMSALMKAISQAA